MPTLKSPLRVFGAKDLVEVGLGSLSFVRKSIDGGRISSFTVGGRPVHNERNFRNGGHTGAAAMSAPGNDRVLVAFDPGISGAAAFHTVEADHLLKAEDLPVVAGQVDAVSLADRLSEMKPVAAFVERVSAMPKQGVSSTFKFGQANGVLIGILAALHVPMHFITPGTWKRHYGLDADKEKSRLKALQLFSESAAFFCEEEGSQQS
jgi:crossover junction endodeoxyribonuclease RuvC